MFPSRSNSLPSLDSFQLLAAVQKDALDPEKAALHLRMQSNRKVHVPQPPISRLLVLATSGTHVRPTYNLCEAMFQKLRYKALT